MQSAIWQSGLNTYGAFTVKDNALRRRVQTQVDPEAATAARQMVGKRARVRHHIMHTCNTMGRLFFGADKHDTEFHQPVDHVGRVVNQDTA